jgi:hypothetical protein
LYRLSPIFLGAIAFFLHYASATSNKVKAVATRIFLGCIIVKAFMVIFLPDWIFE